MICPKTGFNCQCTGCGNGIFVLGYVPSTSQVWQVCPKCEGAGIAMNYSNAVPMTTDTCDVCNGKKIISIHTGLPPQ